ncbi:MAG TPA: hypothetical protein VD886_04875 [Herpetosiphonaceae bacterium]|nr:hypothetical protein [Herpetosiphonaceae bacterium]
MSDTKTAPNQPEHPSQAEGERDTGGPGAQTAGDQRQGSDPARERPSQAEGERNAADNAGKG